MADRKEVDRPATGACISIPSNIAEGSGKRSEKDKHRFMEIALTSAFELETQVLIAERRGWSSKEKRDKLLAAITLEQQKLTAFMAKLNG